MKVHISVMDISTGTTSIKLGTQRANKSFPLKSVRENFIH